MSPPSATAKLFQPIKVGNMMLSHHIALAPLSRFRATRQHVVHDFVAEYYAQRASEPGTLLISEGTIIAGKAGGYNHSPGIWNQEQINAWKKVTEAVHAKGSYIFLQIAAIGRVADGDGLKEEDPSYEVVAPSAIPISTSKFTPRALTIPEIKEYMQLFAKGAANAINEAGFDGVEIHGANGYLIDEFIQDVSNKRDDEYGGSIENRVKFLMEVMEAVTNAVGLERTALRISPWNTAQDMRMADPVPTYTYLVKTLKEKFPDLAYLHVVDPRIKGHEVVSASSEESNDFVREIWSPKPLISAGAYHSVEDVVQAVEKTGDIIAMGRYFISNPDLPKRIRRGIAWSPYNRATFYTPESPVGYTDYPFAEDIA